ncbi:tRNA pseudouridine(55) synthase TruB, partial [bacterium]|nr:tRNA pseudouridine(55) synthase TruB [bacterium]
FSAVKIDGQRAYKLARAGEEMQIAARPLWVEELLLSDRPSADQAVLEMTCGKGGYVRSIARDLGEVLGCYGHVAQLRRLWSGPFDLEHAVSLEQIEPFAKTSEIDQFLRPLEEGLTDLLQGTTNAEGAAKLRNGNPAICFTAAEYGDEIWVSHEGKAQAIGRYKSGEIHPTRVILQE